jgi:hypothetical protein
MKPRQLLTRHPALTFFWMLISGLVLGLSSYNLFFLLKANLELVIDHGWMQLMEGAAEELLMLSAYGVIGLVSYIVFKACEKVLVERLLSGKK